MKLYSFFNSSTSYRVRIALALKEVSYEYVAVNIRNLEHRAPEYLAKNPNGSVPLLSTNEGFELGQSLAIIDYLDAEFPEPRLIPEHPKQRARVLEVATLIGCDIHPVNNLRVLRRLTENLGQDDHGRNTWYQHWVREGMASLEALLTRNATGAFCVGDAPTLADCCLVPQVANALRMNCDLSSYPRVMEIYEHCMSLPAFQAAAPQQQPDFMAA